ncbi:MAG: cytochrome P450 [Actinobacteria bacterium]|nr:cytochrome P450 [Actinomycetota bacterium]
MTDVSTIDYFFDPSLIDDPYDYYDALREKGPVLFLEHLGVVAVTGYDEACDVYRQPELFSSCNSVVGPFAPFPVPLEGDDITDLVAEHRHHMPMHEHLVTMDPPDHTRERALLMRLLTPRRLRENEEFIGRLADELLDELPESGSIEFISTYAQPFAMLVIADLLGIPESEHQRFREGFGLTSGVGTIGKGEAGNPSENPLGWLDDEFSAFVEDRRQNPRQDVLTYLANATYPDGSTPEVTAVVRTATFLFAAGQETTARLLASALKYLGEHPEVQAELRADHDKIPTFLEEILRIESPVKTDFRMTLRNTTLGGVDIPAGTPLMMLNGAANRDPGHFGCPADVQIDRVNAQHHIAFGRGAHSCPGGPLARTEGQISLERILDRWEISLSPEHHGPDAERPFTYEPTWILRGLTELYIDLTPVEVAK